MADNESASKVLLIRDFPPIECQDHHSMLSKMFFTTNKNQVYGSETYNALSAIERDVGTSQIVGVYTFDDHSTDKSKNNIALSDANRKVVVELQKIMHKL